MIRLARFPKEILEEVHRNKLVVRVQNKISGEYGEIGEVKASSFFYTAIMSCNELYDLFVSSSKYWSGIVYYSEWVHYASWEWIFE